MEGFRTARHNCFISSFLCNAISPLKITLIGDTYTYNTVTVTVLYVYVSPINGIFNGEMALHKKELIKQLFMHINNNSIHYTYLKHIILISIWLSIPRAMRNDLFWGITIVTTVPD